MDTDTPTPDQAAAAASAAPAAENARPAAAPVRLVPPQSGKDDAPGYDVPIRVEDLASVEVVDVDMVLVATSGERFLLPEGALRAAMNSRMKIGFAGQQATPAGDLYKKVGGLQPVEGGSFRLQATELKPTPPDPLNGQAIGLGSDDEARPEQIQAMMKMIEQVSQSQQAARLSEAQAKTINNFTATKTADPQRVDVPPVPSKSQINPKTNDFLEQRPETPPGLTSEMPRPQLTAAEAGKVSQVAIWNGTAPLPGATFGGTALRSMLPSDPLKVVVLPGGAAAGQNWDTGTANTPTALADLVVQPIAKATQVRLSLVDTSATLPPGFRVNDADPRTAQTVALDAEDGARVRLQWNVTDDGTNVSRLRFQAVVQYLDADGKTLGSTSLTVSYEDVRTAADLNETDANGLAIAKLPARGMSYDITGRDDADDTIDAGNGDDIVRGLGGADVITGGRGNDILFGGGGNDTLRGNSGNDTLRGEAGSDILDGGAGDDLLIGGAGGDVIDGGAGNNTASYADSAEGVRANLAPSRQAENSGGDAAGDYLTGIQNLTGSDQDDTLTGDAEVNVLRGGGGNDTLEGGAGADILDGGLSGRDTASYANAGASGVVASLAAPATNTGQAAGDTYLNIENLSGSEGADTLTGDDGDNVLSGQGGDDTLAAGAGADTLEGGAGNDILEGGLGGDTLRGNEGTNTAFYGNAASGVVAHLVAEEALTRNTGEAAGDTYTGIQNMTGSRYNDTLVGDAQVNRLAGGQGDDLLIGGGAGDVLVGGDGTDTVSYDGATTGVVASLRDGTLNTGDALGDTYESIENLTGSAQDDTLEGNGFANTLLGGRGRDTFVGRGGGDTYDGGDNADTVDYSSAGNGAIAYLDAARQGQNASAAAGDTFVRVENLTGSAWNDVLVGDSLANQLRGGGGDDLLDGGSGPNGDLLDGGAGTDTVSFASATGAVSASLVSGGSMGDASGDVFTSIENLVGSAHDDVLEGDGSANLLYGLDGNDDLRGGGGTDVLYGGEGNDVLSNLATQDAVQRYFGGDSETDTGNDTVTYAGMDRVIRVSLTAGGSVLDNTGATVVAQQVFNGIENLVGGNLADELEGDARANTLVGGTGADILRGLDGDDNLQGGEGDDTLSGGNGSDFLSGGNGQDTVAYLDSSQGLVIDLTVTTPGALNGQGTGMAKGDAFDSIETVIGTLQDDRFIASTASVRHDGQGGVDTVDYSADANGINVNLKTGVVTVATGTLNSLIAGDSFANIENLVGSATAANRITGSDGNNTLTGGNEADTLAGGNGDDRLIGGGAGDTLQGGSGNDILQGEDGNDWLEGGSGNDTLDGGSGSQDTASYAYASGNVIVDLLNTGAQSVAAGDTDTLVSIENLLGSNGSDILKGNTGVNRIDGDDGSDELWGREGNDILIGGTGDDILIGGAGQDKLVGGVGEDDVTPSSAAGRNTASYEDADAGVQASLTAPGTNTGYAAGDLYVNIQNLKGSDLGDVLEGDAQDNRIEGGGGDDVLIGGAGADQLIGGAGTGDIARYAAQTDLVVDLVDGTRGTGHAFGDIFQGIEIIEGTGNSDRFLDASAAYRFDGKGGVDEVSYELASGVTASLATGGSGGWAAGDTYVSIENLTGSAGADTLTGNSAANVISGGQGNDLLYASLGASDTLNGGQNTDTLSYQNFDATRYGLTVVMDDDGGGTVTVRDGNAADAIVQTDTFTGVENISLRDASATAASGRGGSLTGNALDNVLRGGFGADALSGGGGADTLHGQSGNDTLDGGDGNDALFGGDDNDILTGGEGNDTLDGGAGTDSLAGGAGNDTLRGGDGNDTLSGGAGDDRLYGGAGADVFQGNGSTFTAYDAALAVANQAGDYASFDDLNTALTVDFSNGGGGTGEAQNDVFQSDLTGAIGSNGATTFIGRSTGEVFIGGAGNDVFRGSAGADVFDGKGGVNEADYQSETAAIGVNLQTNVATGGIAAGDVLHNIQTVRGGSGADTLTGKTATASYLYGHGGNDTLAGGNANDELYGGDGNDALTGGDGNDALQAGSGTDNLQGGNGDDILDFSTGNTDANMNSDTASGGAGNDTFIMDYTRWNAGRTGLSADGGANTDTLDLRASSSGTIALADFGSLSNFEKLDLSKDTTSTVLKVSVAGIQNLVDSGTSSQLMLVLGNGVDDFFIDPDDAGSRFARYGANSVTFYANASDLANNANSVAKLSLQYL
ncbi:MAG: hypothetical protein WCJ69_15845 [Betaproteobacteria bacterium]